MKNLRLYSSLPTKHPDFEIRLGYLNRPGRNGDNKHIWHEWDFAILAQSHKIVDAQDPSPQDRYLIKGNVREAFEKMDKTELVFLELGQPNLRTSALIYAYEKYKAT